MKTIILMAVAAFAFATGAQAGNNEQPPFPGAMRVISAGADAPAQAQKFGRQLAHSQIAFVPAHAYDAIDSMIWEEAFRRYPNDRFFARCFHQDASAACAQEIVKEGF